MGIARLQLRRPREDGKAQAETTRMAEAGAGTHMRRLIDLQCDADHIDTDETSLRIARGRLGGRDWSQLMLMVTLIERQLKT